MRHVTEEGRGSCGWWCTQQGHQGQNQLSTRVVRIASLCTSDVQEMVRLHVGSSHMDAMCALRDALGTSQHTGRDLFEQ